MATLTTRKKNQRASRTQAALAQLQTLFPVAFPREDAQIRPLAISARNDLRAWLEQHPQPYPAAMINALQHHCCRETYQRTVIAGVMRVNLLGEPVQPVTPEGQAHAEARLAHIQAEREASAQRKAVKPSPSAKPAKSPKPATKNAVKLKAKAPPPVAVPAPRRSPPMPTVVIKKRRVVVKPA